MKFDFTNLSIQAKTAEELKAAELFSLEIEKRTLSDYSGSFGKYI